MFYVFNWILTKPGQFSLYIRETVDINVLAFKLLTLEKHLMLLLSADIRLELTDF